MRAALTVPAAALVALMLALPATAPARPPSARQIRRAAARAEASSSLWATINVCSSRGAGRGGQMGVRGQMPALGFPARLRMTVRLGYWSTRHERFVPIGGARATSEEALGSRATGIQQGGVEFGFRGSTDLLNATVAFTWSRNGRVIAEADRITTRGHPDADYGHPPHYSADVCRLG